MSDNAHSCTDRTLCAAASLAQPNEAIDPETHKAALRPKTPKEKPPSHEDEPENPRALMKSRLPVTLQRFRSEGLEVDLNDTP